MARYWITFLVFSVLPAPDSPLWKGEGRGTERERERERDRRVKLNHIVLLYCTREVGKRGEFGDYDKWKTEKKSSDKKIPTKVIL